MAFEAIFHKAGGVIDYTPSSAVSAGEIVDLGNRFGIASMDIAASELGALSVEGIYKGQQAAEVIEIGAPVYWDEDGDPYNGTAGTGAITADPGAGNYLGICLATTTATTERCTFDLNANTYGESLPAIMQDKTFETVSDNKTLDAQDVGKVMDVDTDAKTITLPATAAGVLYVIRNAGVDGAVAVTISPNAADKIMGADLAGVDDKDYINTKATAQQGDYVALLGDGSAGWYILNQRGTWAAEA